MRIAQVSPLFESVPPRMYGGTERVVSFLTEELVRMGHDVTLFASADSQTSARLVSPCERAMRLAHCTECMAPHVLMLEQVVQRAHQFDLIHFHTDFHHFPLSRQLSLNTVTTLHGRLDFPELAPLYQEYAEMPLISISNHQRRPLAFANWAGTVYHGIPQSLFRFQATPQRYVAFVGRVSPEKGLESAIRIARAVGLELRIGAKVDPADRDYFEHSIRPLLKLPGVRFLGELGDREKQILLGGALALLFPIDWPEPFGLVMIESMACGTPVIAFRRGSVPEVVDHGRTGYIVDSVEQGVQAVRAAANLSRRRVREVFEQRFSDTRMAEDYLQIYSERVHEGAERLQEGEYGRGIAGADHGRSRLD